MYGREKRVLLREYLEQGRLERDLDEEPVRHKKRLAVERKIDPYRPMIDARLQGFPRLSAVWIHPEIRAAGYAG